MKTLLKNFYIYIPLALIAMFLVWGIYLPKSANSAQVVFSVKKGSDAALISKDLQAKGIIKNKTFFNMYAFLTGRHSKLQAGKY
ncbi:MAG: hypothetical protein AAB877_00340, partial [Patescibacteria group bacterium]